MKKNFRVISKQRTINQTLVGAKVLKVNRNKQSGNFVLVLDNGKLVHIGNNTSGVEISRKSY